MKFLVNWHCDRYIDALGFYAVARNDLNQVLKRYEMSCGATLPDVMCNGDTLDVGDAVTVPSNRYVAWDLADVWLTLPAGPGDEDDPWVIVPPDHGCTALTRFSQCLRPFTSNDPQHVPWNQVE